MKLTRKMKALALSGAFLAAGTGVAIAAPGMAQARMTGCEVHISQANPSWSVATGHCTGWGNPPGSAFWVGMQCRTPTGNYSLVGNTATQPGQYSTTAVCQGYGALPYYYNADR